MESASASLPPEISRGLQAILAARNPTSIVAQKERPGFFGLSRNVKLITPNSTEHSWAVASIVGSVVIGLNKQLAEHSIDEYQGQDRELLEKFFEKLSNTDQNLSGIINFAQTVLVTQSQQHPDDTVTRDFVRAHSRLLEASHLRDPLYAAERQLQLPQAAKLAETAPLWRSALEASQSPETPIAERAALTPSASAAGTATGSYRLRVRVGDGEPVTTGVVGIVKPANQGLAARDNLVSAGKDYQIKEWGLLPGQEVLGEHLTCTIQHRMGLPTNVPDTVTLPLAHTTFGPVDASRRAMHDEFGFDISHRECLEFLAQAPAEADFKTRIVDSAYSKAANDVLFSLAYRGVHPPEDADWKASLTHILQTSATPDDAFKGIAELIGIDTKTTTQYTRDSVFRFVSDSEDAGKGRLEALATNLYAAFDQQPPPDPTLCSVQAWVEGAADRYHVDQADINNMSSISFGRLQLIDGFAVGRDRNAGNFMLVDANQAQIYARLDQQIPGFAQWMRDHIGERLDTHSRSPDPKLQAKRLDDAAESLLVQWERTHQRRIPTSAMQTEWDVHLLVHMYFNQLETVKDIVPIDHGLTYPDPELKSEDGSECLGQTANNSWYMEKQARIGTLPRRTRAHLASLDLRKDVLPGLLSETQFLQMMAPPGSGATMQLNQSQQSLWFLSSRIQQIGARLNATYLEMAVMKDGFPREIGPIKALYDTHCRGRSVEQIDLKQLDRAVREQYVAIRQAISRMQESDFQPGR